MEIRDEHIEFAIVQRFREMLQEPHPRYEVSSVYALFTAILCWSTQRLRTDTKKENSPEARAAASVWADFAREPISLAPWCIDSADFRGRTADRLIKNLRNAVAHGDARKDEPYHTGTRGKPDHTLVGFAFKCEEGKIILLAGDMAKIAGEVARRFCSAMEEMSRDSCLKEYAEKGVEGSSIVGAGTWLQMCPGEKVEAADRRQRFGRSVRRIGVVIGAGCLANFS